ncbi:hypothetical protein E6Q11_06860 [Candidatus Dojkabacteria bacterium]|uniref:Uncharacterized protein n=1 Tax=Candidatus Dojkabacteria bacterium TaxID=2099670 RepID=A0A5C7J2M5_9BACT|nr:MAG: hypothetical protein E6Q11_06860 [Candidatus Dojkabacteria bacterium]
MLEPNNLDESRSLPQGDISDNLFFADLCRWLEEKGFVNNRGWGKKRGGIGFYSFQKGKYRFEIKTDWNLKYDWYEPIVLDIIDCEKEFYCDVDYIGWMGRKHLNRFAKPFSRSFFDGLCEYYGI